MVPSQLKLRFLAIIALSLLAAVSPALAQQWPDKPIRLVVAAPPAGISDMVARLLAEQLRLNLGQTVLVDNKPGGAAAIAEQAVMAAPADGYTWMVGPSSIMSDIPLTVKKPYDVLKTFTYVAEASSMIHVLVASASFPPNNVNEVLDYAKRNPRAVGVANLSVGTRSHLLGEMLKQKSGTDMVIVPYKGSGPAMTDLLGNQVQMTFEVVSNVVPFIKSGKLKALAITSKSRVAAMPDVPTLAEAGVNGAESGSWIGLLAPAGTPQDVIDKLSQGLRQAAATPEVEQQLLAQGAVAKAGTPADFAQLIAEDRKRYAKIIIDNKLVVD